MVGVGLIELGFQRKLEAESDRDQQIEPCRIETLGWHPETWHSKLGFGHSRHFGPRSRSRRSCTPIRRSGSGPRTSTSQPKSAPGEGHVLLIHPRSAGSRSDLRRIKLRARPWPAPSYRDTPELPRSHRRSAPGAQPAARAAEARSKCLWVRLSQNGGGGRARHNGEMRRNATPRPRKRETPSCTSRPGTRQLNGRPSILGRPPRRGPTIIGPLLRGPSGVSGCRCELGLRPPGGGGANRHDCAGRPWLRRARCRHGKWWLRGVSRHWSVEDGLPSPARNCMLGQ